MRQNGYWLKACCVLVTLYSTYLIPLCAAGSCFLQRSAADHALRCVNVPAGYSLNALVDFPADDPIEIIKHLIIGSEGTLGFVSQATYNTVPEWPHKASAFIVFPDVRAACQAASILRDETAVDAVELFDRSVGGWWSWFSGSSR